MPKVGKSKKGASRAGSAAEGRKRKGKAEFAPLVIPPEIEEYVTLDIKIINWRFMDFEYRTKTSTPFFVVKRMLQDRNGRTDDISIYLAAVSEDNRVKDEMKTLRESGIQGADVDADAVHFPIYFDFKPADPSEPVLLTRNTNGLEDDL